MFNRRKTNPFVSSQTRFGFTQAVWRGVTVVYFIVICPCILVYLLDLLLIRWGVLRGADWLRKKAGWWG